jgi:DNA-binding Lrp family transcriptional regulator
MDQVERCLLNYVQTSFPVTKRPYHVLGQLVGIDEGEAQERIQRLRREGIIRRLGAVLNSRRIGYYSTLCAAKVSGEKISLLSGMLEQMPGVTHNYLRTHDYNLWFTLIASSQKKAEALLAGLREKSGVSEIYSLPALRMFKIKVDFDFMEQGETIKADGGNSCSVAKVAEGYMDTRSVAVKELTTEEIELVKLLQENLPDGLTPYAELAEMLAWPEEIVLDRINVLQGEGVIRRFGAVLRHQKAGFTANAMGVWQVPDERAAEVGLIMSGFKEVSHCYQRPVLPDWPYNLFTMIHGRSRESCMRVMEDVARATKIETYDMLFSTVELKKSSMKYFMD